MAKSFDDFDGLTEDEILEIQRNVAAKLGLEKDGDVTSIPLAELPMYLVVLNQALNTRTLRKYHEWVNS